MLVYLTQMVDSTPKRNYKTRRVTGRLFLEIFRPHICIGLLLKCTFNIIHGSNRYKNEKVSITNWKK